MYQWDSFGSQLIFYFFRRCLRFNHLGGLGVAVVYCLLLVPSCFPLHIHSPLNACDCFFWRTLLVACQYFIIFIVPLQVTGEVHLHQPRDQSQIEPLSHLGREITVDRQGRIGQAFDGARVARLKRLRRAEVCISHACFAHYSQDVEVLYVAESCIMQLMNRWKIWKINFSHVLLRLCKFVVCGCHLIRLFSDSCWFVFERLALPVTTWSWRSGVMQLPFGQRLW